MKLLMGKAAGEYRCFVGLKSDFVSEEAMRLCLQFACSLRRENMRNEGVAQMVCTLSLGVDKYHQSMEVRE